MYPIDPVEITNSQNDAPMAPPYVDEDVNLTLTEQGLAAAENEKRDAVTDEYEKQAVRNEDSSESLDDIAYPSDRAKVTSPELSAMHDLDDSAKN